MPTEEDVEAAWQEGYRYKDNEVDEFIAGKDDFISKQELIIVRLMDVITEANAWHHVPDDLREELRDYV